jgi:hypothetical protein
MGGGRGGRYMQGLGVGSEAVIPSGNDHMRFRRLHPCNLSTSIARPFTLHSSLSDSVPCSSLPPQHLFARRR